MVRRSYAILILSFITVFGLCQIAWPQPRRRPVTIDADSSLPLRVLVRPLSHIYKEKNETKGIVKENVPTFQSYYVYATPRQGEGQQGQGWYEVGTNVRGTIIGWLRAEDGIEWKQAMSLAYTHPKGRQPVLKFAHPDALLELIGMPAETRKEKAQQLYAAINSEQELPNDFPVISIEPENMIDIQKEFYLLPIIDFKEIEIDFHEGRLVKLAAATAFGEDVRVKTVLASNLSYRQEATTTPAAVTSEDIKKLEADIVFVIDTTRSMQPYIEGVRAIIRNAVREIAQQTLANASMRFGMWGYRDDPALSPGIDYHTKNFTPTLLRIEAFEAVLALVREAEGSTKGYPEDVFSGVYNALTQTAWRPGALRFLVLIGDAPGHEGTHPQNLSKLDAKTLRLIANDENTYIMAFYIKNPQYARYHGTAAYQFRQLATNMGLRDGPSYDDQLQSGDLASFQEHLRGAFRKLVQIIEETTQGRVPQSPKPLAADAPPQATVEHLAADMGYAAVLQWIGRQTRAKAPRDITAWAVDRDLMDPAIQSTDVKILLNKRQLDDLRTILNSVIAAGKREQISTEDFFTSLQAASATVVREPDQVKNARRLADSGLIPDFLKGLPYKSRLMNLTNEWWESRSDDEQEQFLDELEALVKYYATVHDTQDGWIRLNPQDDPEEAVFPVSLEALP